MSFLGISGKCIFAAPGQNLKISSMNKNPFEIVNGNCELREVKTGSYFWQISDSKRKKNFKFKTGKETNIVVHNRDGQFTIVVKYNGETTQLIGKLDGKDCSLLLNTMDNINEELNTDGKWLSASKENIPKDNNAKENGTTSVKSRMTGVMERNGTSKQATITKQPLSDKSSLKSVVGKNSLQLTPERTPLGDKQGPVSKNRTLGMGRLLPSPSTLAADKKAESDEIKITAYGGSKTSNKFYGDKHKTPERPKVRQTYTRRNSLSSGDHTSTSSNWSFRDRDDLLKSPKTENIITSPGVVGFSNLGNTCYMNSILQCLLNIPTFFQDLNNIDNLELVQHSSLYNSLCNLGILKYSYETLENQRFALQRVKNAISNAATRFSGYAQHDAHELLCQCLDQLKEDLISETKKKLQEREDRIPKLKELEENGCSNCPIKSNFESTILHSITCESCDEKVVKEEVCHDFSLVIPDFDENTNPVDQTLEDLIKLYFDSEMIEYSCEKCKGSYSVLSHQFSKLPRVLIVHIKRYDMNDVKKTDRICIPKSLNLTSHMNDNTKTVSKFIYDKNKLKSKGENEYKLTKTSEKRKSPGELDIEPRQKQYKSSRDSSTCDILEDLENQYSTPSARKKITFDDNKNDETMTSNRNGADQAMKNKINGTDRAMKSNRNGADQTLKSNRNGADQTLKGNRNGANQISVDSDISNDVDDETIAKALHSNSFTQVISSNSKEDLSGGTSTSSTAPEIIPDDENPSAMGIYTSVLDDEDEDLKRALDLSMREYEKAQMESIREFEQQSLMMGDTDSHLNDKTDMFDMGPTTAEEELDEKDKENMYKLVGIVNHHGQNTGTGHYTSDSFDFKSKKWRCYNDSSVKEINQHEVRFGRSHSAYIVFYMHNQCYDTILNAH